MAGVIAKEAQVGMQLSSLKKNPLRRVGVGVALLVVLAMFISPAFAEEAMTMAAAQEELAKPLLADPPAFLAPAPSCKKAEDGKGEEGAITPFIGTNNHALTLLPTPERPAIVAREGVLPERPEVTAGVNVDLGTVKFNLGYTLPSHQVDEIVQPLGVDHAPGPDGKCFSLGVKIPF